jgi:alpha-ribazole phosphatase
MNATRLVLVRHGEPCEQLQGRCYGRVDGPLSPRGRSQMAETAAALASYTDAVIVSSDSQRAVESAEVVAGPKRGILSDPRLREIDFGAADGLTYREIEERYPDLFREWMQRPTEVTFPDAEPFAAMTARVRGAIADLQSARRHAATVVVSHGGVNRIVLADALGLPLPAMFRIGQDYGGISVIDYFEGGAVVRMMNAHPGGPC